MTSATSPMDVMVSVMKKSRNNRRACAMDSGDASALRLPVTNLIG
jgi:hypothetical protein